MPWPREVGAPHPPPTKEASGHGPPAQAPPAGTTKPTSITAAGSPPSSNACGRVDAGDTDLAARESEFANWFAENFRDERDYINANAYKQFVSKEQHRQRSEP